MMQEVDEESRELTRPEALTEVVQNGIEETSFLRLNWEILKLAISMGAADTFAWKNMFLPLLWSVNGSSSKHIAALAPLLSTLNMTLVSSLAPIFGISLVLPKVIGEYDKLLADHPDALANPDHPINAEILIKQREITSFYRNGLMTLGLAPAAMAIFCFSSPMLHYMFRQDEEISEIVQSFLRPYSLAIPGTFFYIVTGQILQNFKNTHGILLVALVNLAISLGLAYSLSAGIVLPKMETTGLLIGYSIEPYLTSIAFASYLFFHPQFKNFSFFKSLFSSLSGNMPQLKKLFSSGSAITSIVIVEMLCDFGLSVISGIQGEKAQEAFAMTMFYLLANTILAVQCPLAGAIKLGNVIGAQQDRAVYKVAKAGLTSSLALCSIIPIIFAAYPESLMFLFSNHDDETLKTLKILAPIISTAAICAVFRYLFSMHLRRLGDLRYSTIICCTGQALGLALSVLLGLKMDMGVIGIGTGYALGMFLSALCLAGMWYKKLQPYREIQSIPPAQVPTMLEPAAENNEHSARPSPYLSRLCFWRRMPEPTRPNPAVVEYSEPVELLTIATSP